MGAWYHENSVSCSDLPAPVLSVSSPPLTTAGEVLSVTCTATVEEFLITTPTLLWLNSDGSVVTTTGNPTAPGSAEVNGEVSTLELTFSPLRTSHGGQYRCRASIDIPDTASVQATMAANITVQSES